MKMIQKIKQWFSKPTPDKSVPDTFTRAEVIKLIEETRAVAYTDGKRDGLTVAREQATKSLKEILWQQNKTK